MLRPQTQFLIFSVLNVEKQFNKNVALLNNNPTNVVIEKIYFNIHSHSYTLAHAYLCVYININPYEGQNKNLRATK